MAAARISPDSEREASGGLALSNCLLSLVPFSFLIGFEHLLQLANVLLPPPSFCIIEAKIDRFAMNRAALYNSLHQSTVHVLVELGSTRDESSGTLTICINQSDSSGCRASFVIANVPLVLA